MPPTRTVPQNGSAIRALREKDGLKITAFAERIGITPQSLSNIELNNKPVSAVLLNRIARELRVDIGAISNPQPVESESAAS